VFSVRFTTKPFGSMVITTPVVFDQPWLMR
jgi:hypothetical protein